MNDEHSGILVGEAGDLILIRLKGRGTYLNSHLLKQYFMQVLNEGRRSFRLDLSECTYLDSTFLGVLARIGTSLQERSLSPVKIVNAPERIRGMLENLGIDHLFKMVAEEISSDKLSPLQRQEISKEAKSIEMLESHEKLAELSKSNEAKFKDVITLLRKKVGKSGSC